MARYDGALKDLRLLLVEDEYFVARDLAHMLLACGADVVGPISEVDAALAIARVERLDGAVLDVDLQGERVYPLADELSRRNIPFLFASGYDTAAIDERYRDVPRLAKPFGPDRLIAGVRASLARPPRPPR